MRTLTVKGIRIDDTFAEAFGMRATAVIITADTARWARQAAITMTGFATSVIGCGCEAGIDRPLDARATPDGRPGVRVLLFAVSTSELQKQLSARVAQCVLTSPGSACYAGLAGTESLRLGNALRYFGDGWQISKRFGGKHHWRIPVMDGEFVCDATNDAYSPTLKGAVKTALDADIASVLEIVIDGLTSQAVADAMRAGIAAIVKLGPKRGAVRIGAGNYGGKLGPHHYHLKDLLP
jgi:formylmethanofuran--tetrahydromethanopterin N-formyltransferase